MQPKEQRKEQPKLRLKEQQKEQQPKEQLRQQQGMAEEALLDGLRMDIMGQVKEGAALEDIRSEVAEREGALQAM